LKVPSNYFHPAQSDQGRKMGEIAYEVREGPGSDYQGRGGIWLATLQGVKYRKERGAVNRYGGKRSKSWRGVIVNASFFGQITRKKDRKIWPALGERGQHALPRAGAQQTMAYKLLKKIVS